MASQLALTVAEAGSKDVGRGIGRIDPHHFDFLQVEIGDIIQIKGKRITLVRVLPSFLSMRQKDHIQIDGITRQNALIGLDEKVVIEKAEVELAKKVSLSSSIDIPPKDQASLSTLLENLPIMKGDKVRINLFGSSFKTFKVEKIEPYPTGLINKETTFIFHRETALTNRNNVTPKGEITYEDIGGLHKQTQKIREIIELPLKYPEVFSHLGIEAPKGVLLHGPPGTGKTLIARAVANETNAHFISINGPEIINKFYGESEAQLRNIFEEAEKKGPSILFLDEIDAIAQKRAETKGDVERRVVAQLLALMDGLKKRGEVVVIGATNLVHQLDPALRRPGRFDREISIDAPDRKGREEILRIHTRGMELHNDVDLSKLGEITHGFVGADLEALVREAAMNALRNVLPHMDLAINSDIYSKLLSLSVTMNDFLLALPQVQPSALREVFMEIPSTSWKDIGGLEDVKARLIEAIEWPFLYEDLFKAVDLHPPKGILIYGPPGTGKTMLAKAVAYECKANFIAIKGPSLFSKWVGESERKMREIFQKAREAAPAIIFFDEIEALTLQNRGEHDSGVGGRIISQLLNELDGIESLQGVVVIGATNRKELIDPALLRPGRFDLHIQLLPPDRENRRAIFQVHMRKKPLDTSVNLEELVMETKGLVGAHIEAICQQGAMSAIRRSLKEREKGESSQLLITMEDLRAALTIIKENASSFLE